ncbi:GIY-YIG nuclease family protein [Desulfoscipio geothermicus]|uniref:GIY-YIG nuclease family protein n=1 Tax=Desulfoscipio geothermicus TaxID=39060 RepID=UPI003183F098
MYILKCCDGTLYTGYAADPANRLEKHNRGLASKYTRSRLPVELVYLELAGQKERHAAGISHKKDAPAAEIEPDLWGWI